MTYLIQPWSVRSVLLVGGLLFATSASAADTLEKIAGSGTIVLGYRESSIPFSYMANNQQPVGYSIDLCTKVVEAVRVQLKRPDVKVQYKMVTSANRMPLLKEGAIDLECGSTTNTLERGREVAFSVTTFVAAARLVAKKSSKVRTLLDLKNKTVVGTAGTTNLKQLTEVNERDSYHMTIVPVKDHAEAFAMVEDDRATAFVLDDILLASLVAGSKKPSDYVLTVQALSVEPYGIMLRRDDPRFKAVVDSTVVGVFQSGEIHTLYKKWFQTPIPSKGINLNVPMGGVLKRVIATPTDSGNPTHYY